MEEKVLTKEQQEAIKARIAFLKKENPKLKNVYHVVVFGEEGDSKDMYVAYFRKPNLKEYSKWLSLMKKDEVMALRALAIDCFLDGDKELLDDEDLFLFGTMNNLSGIMQSRQVSIENF